MAGDRIYVAVGLDANGASDGFTDFGFSITALVPELSTGLLLALGCVLFASRRKPSRKR